MHPSTKWVFHFGEGSTHLWVAILEDGGAVWQHFCLGERAGMVRRMCVDRSLYSLLADIRKACIFAFLVATVKYPASFDFSEARGNKLIRKVRKRALG